MARITFNKRNFNDVAWQIFNERTLIYQKNNELKLPDGSSIQDALVKVELDESLTNSFILLNDIFYLEKGRINPTGKDDFVWQQTK